MRPSINKKRHKRDRSVVEANAPPKVLRKYHASIHPTQDTRGGKSLTAIGVGPEPPPIHSSSKGTATEIPTKGVATTEACQDMVDHIVSPGFFSELRHLPNTEFLAQYNVNLERQVALGSQMRLRFEQEVRLLKKARAQVARRNERIQVMEEEIKRLGKEVESLKVVEAEVHGLRNQMKNLETLLEAEVDMKKATEAKNAELAKELESLCAKFSDLQLNNNQLSQQVSTHQAQVTGEERIKATFKEFKKYEDNKVEQRCAEMDARLDKLSVDIDEELLAKGMSEGLKYDIKHGKVGRDLADVEAYDPEANNKLVKALQDLKDLKYLMVDQLEKLKDAPMELIMTSLHLESDTGEDSPHWIRDLRPSSSQLKIPIYPEVRAPEDPWSVKEEVPLEDAIAANISRAEKKKKCRVVCRTHRIGSVHHVRSDGIPVSVPTIVP
ncbi:hypothetical protein Tco_0597066 [Tanacetum coccineum]